MSRLIANLISGVVSWALVSGLLAVFLPLTPTSTILKVTTIAFVISYMLLVILPSLIAALILDHFMRKAAKDLDNNSEIN